MAKIKARCQINYCLHFGVEEAVRSLAWDLFLDIKIEKVGWFDKTLFIEVYGEESNVYKFKETLRRSIG